MTARLCVVCVHERDDEHKRVMAGYGQPDHARSEWSLMGDLDPTDAQRTEISGWLEMFDVHRACFGEFAHQIRFADDSRWVDGAYRWKSNGRAAPADCVRMAIRLGLADPARLATHMLTAELETRKFLAAYRANPPRHSDETIAEMRAAFGPGETVVDVVTGLRTRL